MNTWAASGSASPQPSGIRRAVGSSSPAATPRSTAPPTAGRCRTRIPLRATAMWQTGLPAAVMGTPALDGAGVLAVPTMPRQAGETSAVYLLNESNGQVLGTINTGNTPAFAQPVFADNYVFVATAGGGVTAYDGL